MLSKLTVWYNTKCPICDAGIGAQRNRLVEAVRAGLVAFRDINEQPDALASYGAGVNDVRRRLHAVDADGILHVGIDCAIEIFRRSPGQGWMASVLSLPVVRQVAGFGYDRFADVLYAWNRRKGRW